jgi:hypothetical protein
MPTEFWLRKISHLGHFGRIILKKYFRKLKRNEVKWRCSAFTFSRDATCRPFILVTAKLTDCCLEL